MKHIKIRSGQLLYWAIMILLLLTCLPITICLPGSVRQILQLVAIGLFLLGLIINKEKKYLVGYMVIVIFSSIYVWNTWKYTQNISTCLFNVLAGFAFYYYGFISLGEKKNNKKYIKRVIDLLIILVMISAVTTIIGLQMYPLAVRELGRSGSGYDTVGEAFTSLKRVYRMHNIAGWSMAYGMIFFPPCMFILFKIYRKKMYLFLGVIVQVCIIKTQLTTGMILSILSIALLLYNPSRKVKDVLSITFTIMAGIIVLLFIDKVLLLASELLKYVNLPMLATKLQDLILSMSSVNAVGDIGARFDRYGKSLDVFFKYPIFGASISNISKEGLLGHHSEFFDILGYYGGFGIAFIGAIFIRLFDHINKRISYGMWNLVVIFIEFLLLFILNPIWYSPQIYAIGVMFPLCIYGYNSLKQGD